MIFMTDNEAKRQSICPIHTHTLSAPSLSLSLALSTAYQPTVTDWAASCD